MRGASRWHEPKVVESFLPSLTAGMNCTVAPLFGVDVSRFAVAVFAIMTGVQASWLSECR